MIFSQTEFDICLEWGEQGVNLLAPISDAVIIVDVLSFTTSVEIATSRKAIVYPYRSKNESAQEFARAMSAGIVSKNLSTSWPATTAKARRMCVLLSSPFQNLELGT